MKVAAAVALLCLAACAAPPATEIPKSKPLSEVLASSPAADWRRLDPANTLYMELPGGRVVIELAPAFAPNKEPAGHVDVCLTMPPVRPVKR